MKKTRVAEKPWCPGKAKPRKDPGSQGLARWLSGREHLLLLQRTHPHGVPSISLVALNHLLCKFQRLQCPLLAPVVTRNMCDAHICMQQTLQDIK